VADSCQTCACDLLPGGVGRGMSGDRGEERFTLEGVKLGVDGCLDGRCPRHVAQQRDLAEVVPVVRGGVHAAGVDF
jgi:hypothetical protein